MVMPSPKRCVKYYLSLQHVKEVFDFKELKTFLTLPVLPKITFMLNKCFELVELCIYYAVTQFLFRKN